MAKDRVERQLEHLKALRLAGLSEATEKELRTALNDRVNLIVAKAASIAGEMQARALLPDLITAFARLFLKASDSDPQCAGKNAIAKALKDLELSQSEVFLRGLQHRQLESTWGGKTDTASALRGTCALALVGCIDLPRHQILVALVNAATEPDARVRADAALALEQMGGRDVELVLRLKARAGDLEVRVTGQVLESLLRMDGPASVPFVAEFLHHANEEVVEEAALALGASRLPEALEILKNEWLNRERHHNPAILFRAISASRLDAAFEFLLEQIRSARLTAAEEALRAFELHRDSEQIVKRIEEAVASREELLPLFQQRFSGE